MASYFSSTLISSPLLPALRGVFLCGTLRYIVAPHRDHVATSVNMWQMPEHHGNYTVTGAAIDVLFAEPATQLFFTDALPRDATAKIAKGCC